MAIDRGVIGTTLPAHSVDVERGRLRFFAATIGEADPVYSDTDAARAAGHRDLPVPPTFLFCLDMERPDPFGLLHELDVDLRTVLHGEQHFTYHSTAHAGDRLTFEGRVTDVFTKRNGALTFMVRTTQVTRDGTPVATMTNTLVVRA